MVALMTGVVQEGLREPRPPVVVGELGLGGSRADAAALPTARGQREAVVGEDGRLERSSDDRTAGRSLKERAQPPTLGRRIRERVSRVKERRAFKRRVRGRPAGTDTVDAYV